jgi:hypothetical protein
MKKLLSFIFLISCFTFSSVAFSSVNYNGLKTGMSMDEVIEFLNLEKIVENYSPTYYKFEDLSPELWPRVLVTDWISRERLWEHQDDGTTTKYVEFQPPDSLRLKFTGGDYYGDLWSIEISYYKTRHSYAELQWIAWKKALEKKFGDTAELIEEDEYGYNVIFIDHDVKNAYISYMSDSILENKF